MKGREKMEVGIWRKNKQEEEIIERQEEMCK
jgi:hypothetical protein